MPLTTRAFNFLDGLDTEGVGVSSAIVQEMERLIRKLRSRSNFSQLSRAYRGEPANFGLKLAGMDELHDLKALGEILGIEELSELRDPDRVRDLNLAIQTEGELRDAMVRVGAPDSVSAELLEFQRGVIEDIGPSSGGVNKSLNLFINNWMTENQIFSMADIPEDGSFTQDAANFVAMLEMREQVANDIRLLDEANFNDPDNELVQLAAGQEMDPAQFAVLLQDRIAQNRSDLADIQIADDNSLIARTYRQAIDSEFINGTLPDDVNDREYSPVTDEDWDAFLLVANSFGPEIGQFYENNRQLVEDAYLDRPDKSRAFSAWSLQEYSSETQKVVAAYSPAALGFRADPVLDPLINAYVKELPPAFQQQARERIREQVAALQIGGNQNKAELFVNVERGIFGETPDKMVDRYLQDLIMSKPGGREFVEAAKAQGLSMLGLANTSLTDPTDWLKSISENGSRGFGLPPVGEVDDKTLNNRAFAIEQVSKDPKFRDAPAVVREEIISEITRQFAVAGLDPLNSQTVGEYRSIVTNVEARVKRGVLQSIVQSVEGGDRLWETLTQRAESNSTSVLEEFNKLDVDKETLLLENLKAELETQIEALGPSPAEAALAGFGEQTRFLPAALQATANARIERFIGSFAGEEVEDVLAREDVQDRIDLIIEGVGMEFLGDSEVVDEAVSAFGGFNEFFEIFPQLQEFPIEDLQDFIVDNFDTILAEAGPDGDFTKLNRAKANVEQDRLREDLQRQREALNLEDEQARLEFDASPQGRQLAQLQETERRRTENLNVFRPELERAVRGRIAGPAASQVLADVAPQLERQFLAQRDAAFSTEGAVAVTPEDFLSGLGEDFFQRERRRSNIRRSPVNIAAPTFAGATASSGGPGFNPLRRGT